LKNFWKIDFSEIFGFEIISLDGLIFFESKALQNKNIIFCAKKTIKDEKIKVCPTTKVCL
jgi:hypothetical protein